MDGFVLAMGLTMTSGIPPYDVLYIYVPCICNATCVSHVLQSSSGLLICCSLSGRIRKGPAPLNMEVPPYRLLPMKY